MLKVNGLTYRYTKEFYLNFPDFELERGEQALVLGQSGCGKTTLLHLLAGLLKPLSGELFLGGEIISKLSGAALDSYRGKNIGVIFQTPHFIEALSVKENILLAQKLSGNGKNIDSVKKILKELGIENKLNSKVKELSQGEKQRVSIARTLITSPRLILADEPTSALDDENCTAVIRLLKEQAKKHNASLLIVTHDNRLKSQFDKSIELNAGEVKIEGGEG